LARFLFQVLRLDLKLNSLGRKQLYRLWAKKDGYPSFDVLALPDEKIQEGETIRVRDFVHRTERFIITPEKVEDLLPLVWDGKLTKKLPNLHEAREYSEIAINHFDPEVLHPTKPKKYHVYLTEKLYNLVYQMVEDITIWKEVK